ncbi:MAG: hypothetical protein FNP40_03780 [Dehalobacter sp. 4CP]|uniref:hypothetical protein n=1 Tax=Dehalobacter sp. CP TaxID=2594474 RepID=UPI0013C8D304|nr:hypothetical protein [Dehalobacter sp. 4CP]
MNDSAPLTAIVFLEQAAENNIVKLEKAEAMMRLISNSFLPFWSENLMNAGYCTRTIKHRGYLPFKMPPEH